MTETGYQQLKRCISSLSLAFLLITLASLIGCSGGSKGNNSDQIPPTSSIVAPVANTMLAGIVPISADAQDSVGVSSVSFYIDDQLQSTDSSSPYSHEWDTSSVNDGVHSIKVIAADAAGNTAESVISVSVDNTAPGVALTSPIDGAMQVGIVTISADAQDNSGLSSVRFYIDDQLQSTDTSSPYTYDWASSSVNDGIHSIKVIAADAAGNTAESVISVSVDNTAPGVALTSPIGGAMQVGIVRISADAQDNTSVSSVRFYIDDQLQSTDTSSPYSFDWVSSSVNDGIHSIKVIAADAVGNTAESAISVNVDNTAPGVAFNSPLDGAVVSGNVNVEVSAGDANGIHRVEFMVDGTLVNSDISSPFGFVVDTTLLTNAGHSLQAIAYDNTGLSASQQISITVDNGTQQIPDDPATQAPVPDPTVVGSIDGNIAFLYSGNDPVQTGVVPGTIKPRQVSVLRGQVYDENNNPLPGVTITVVGRPEFGQTLSRADGVFDLAVNGGGSITLNYALQGYLTLQRKMNTPWRDYINAPDVFMKPLDSQVTSVALGSGTMQMARGSAVTDDDGSRQATLLVPANTTAQLVLPDGSSQGVSSLSIRATEYTVGENGPLAMPAPLPPTSGYTYAVEFSADEAIAAGASEVTFNQPVYFYVDDFIGFPVGSAVPTGYYDRDRAQWLASKNGRVIKILAINNNLAELDTNGDGVIDDAATLASLNVSNEERSHLGALYSAGQQLWRVPINHFSPYDCNWFQRKYENAEDPDPDLLDEAVDLSSKQDDDSCGQQGYSTLNCQGQSLSESVSITGTPFTLNYSSRRTEGDKRTSFFPIRLVGDTLPDLLQAIRVHVSVAGRVYEAEFDAPVPNQEFIVEWDGLNSFGQPVFGSIPVAISLEYGYPNNYYAYESSFENGFARLDGIDLALPPAAPARTLGWNNIAKVVMINRPNSNMWQSAQWSLNVHHVYDSSGKILYLGDGGTLGGGSSGLDRIIQRVSAPGLLGSRVIRSIEPHGIVSGSDGSIYVTDTGWHHIWKIPAEGNIEFFAGTPNSLGYSGDGGLARAARLNTPMSLAMGPDGSVYIADTLNNVVRRVTPDGLIDTVAGNGSAGYSGDGGPATGAQLNNPVDVAVSTDGSLYIADRFNNRVRWVGTDGIITTLAGTGDAGFSGDGGPAKDAWLDRPTGLEVNTEGSVYIADSGNRRVRKVSSEGIITTVAGNGSSGSSGDGGLAVDASLTPWDVAYNGGALFVTTTSNDIRRIGPEGFISTEAGGAECFDFLGCYSGDDGPGSAASLNRPKGIDILPNGELIFVDGANYVVRSLQATLPGFSTEDITLVSGDGNLLYHFLPNGKHKQTLNTRTGATIYEFSYDNAGRLITITDGYGQVTTLERDGSGLPTAVLGPYGHRTVFTLDANQALASIENPAGERYQFQYTPDGLLTQKVDPAGFIFDFSYGALGELVQADAVDGSQHRLARALIPSGDEVTVSTALDHDTVYRKEQLAQGGSSFTTTYPTGLQLLALINPDGSQVQTAPDGTVTEINLAPDPRWGMQAPLIAKEVVRTPGNVQNVVETSREVTYSLPGDPLSLSSQTDTLVINGKTFSHHQDIPSGEVISRTPLLRESLYQLDDHNRVLLYQGPGVAEVHASYDQVGRPETITLGASGDPEARTYSFSYDVEGNLSIYTDALFRAYQLAHDQAGRITSITTPDNRTVSYGYNARGELSALTPPGKPAHFLSYSAGKMYQQYDPPGLNNATVYNYDSERKTTSIVQQGITAVNYGYDATGRFERLILARGEIVNSYVPTTGKLATVSTPDGNSLSYLWDGFLLNRLTWAGEVAGRVDFTYNSDFEIASVSVNNASALGFLYDDDGLLTSAGGLQLTRDLDSGAITTTSMGNIETGIQYNQFREIEAESAIFNGSSLYSASYTQDKLGRLLTHTETIAGVTSNYAYSYDTADRLATVNLDGTPIASYSYDFNGNRISQTINAVTTDATFDAQDRLLSSGSTTYTYTDNGDLLTKTAGANTTAYDYDAIGNLLSVTLPGGTVIDYIVDGRNQRIGKKVNGTLAMGLLYQDGLRPVAQLDGSNTIVSRFVYANRPNVPAYMIRDGNTYRMVSDRLGSIRLVVNVVDGSIAQRIDYDVFGHVLVDTNPGFQPFGFAGGLYDHDTGLVRFGVRDYDAETGRWTSKDPVLFIGGDTNLYRYSRGDPVNYIDPQGLWYSPYQMWCALMKIARQQQEQERQCRAGAYSRKCRVKWDPSDPFKDGVDPHKALDAMEEIGEGINEIDDILGDLGDLGIDIETPIPLEWLGGVWGSATKAGREAADKADNRHSDLHNEIF